MTSHACSVNEADASARGLVGSQVFRALKGVVDVETLEPEAIGLIGPASVDKYVFIGVVKALGWRWAGFVASMDEAIYASTEATIMVIGKGVRMDVYDKVKATCIHARFIEEHEFARLLLYLFETD